MKQKPVCDFFGHICRTLSPMEDISTQTHDYRIQLETDLRQIKINTNLKIYV